MAELNIQLAEGGSLNDAEKLLTIIHHFEVNDRIDGLDFEPFDDETFFIVHFKDGSSFYLDYDGKTLAVGSEVEGEYVTISETTAEPPLHEPDLTDDEEYR